MTALAAACAATAPATAGAELYSASCSVNPSGPMVSIRQGDPVSVTVSLANRSSHNEGFKVVRDSNVYLPASTTRVLVPARLGIVRHYDLATDRLPVGVMRFNYDIFSLPGRVGRCHFTLEILPKIPPQWTTRVFGPLLPRDEIILPIKWCTIDGASESQLDRRTRDKELFALSALASDIYQRNGARIDFRGAMLRNIALQYDEPNYPLIADPRPPSQGGPGPLGAVEIGSFAPNLEKEFAATISACRDAWDALQAEWNLTIRGVLAVRATALLDGDNKTAGVGPNWATPAELVCTNPTGLTHNTGYIMIADEGAKPNVVAHELGHVLQLGHGNGLDDDGDGLIDDECDGSENPSAEPRSLMYPDTSGTETLTALQRETARAAAFVTEGATRLRPVQSCLLRICTWPFR